MGRRTTHLLSEKLAPATDQIHFKTRDFRTSAA